MLGAEGFTAIAPDWIGHGDSDKPGDFDCSEDAYINQLDAFINAVGIKKPYALVVQVARQRCLVQAGRESTTSVRKHHV